MVPTHYYLGAQRMLILTKPPHCDMKFLSHLQMKLWDQYMINYRPKVIYMVELRFPDSHLASKLILTPQ